MPSAQPTPTSAKRTRRSSRKPSPTRLTISESLQAELGSPTSAPSLHLSSAGSDLEKQYGAQLWDAGERTFCLQSTDPYRRSTLQNARSKPRADFVWLPEKLAVEIQGGTFQRASRHSREPGYGKDCEKGNYAQLDGWMHLRFNSKHVESGFARDLTLEALEVRRGN
jgi:very-short-patch-repair endonuclease